MTTVLTDVRRAKTILCDCALTIDFEISKLEADEKEALARYLATIKQAVSDIEKYAATK